MKIDRSAWKLTFSEDFANPPAIPARWNSRYFWGGRSLASNGELQYFADGTTAVVAAYPDVDPFRLETGGLVITARPSPAPHLSDGLPFVSGLITSHGHFEQMYGYFEIRAKLPAGQGLWPAFWLLPADGGWPPEIDVFECLGHDCRSYHVSTHWRGGGRKQSHTKAVGTMSDLSSGFHSFGMLWESDLIAWYLDDIEVHRWPAPPAMFDRPMYLLAGLMVGGEWPGVPDAGTRFPAELVVEHVRVYRTRS
jgi:beta-glucanase (GH16 family)